MNRYLIYDICLTQECTYLFHYLLFMPLSSTQSPILFVFLFYKNIKIYIVYIYYIIFDYYPFSND